MTKYYDRHYPDTQLDLTDIEEKLADEKEKSDNLTEWPPEN